MIQFRDRTIRGEKIQVHNKDAFYFGPQLHLVDCTVELRTNANALTITDTTFEQCHINASKKLNGFSWYYSTLKDCRLVGTYSDCDFGHWPEDEPSTGGIVNCDLSDAVLDGCRFLDCDASTLIFPSWPCFTVLDPVGHIAQLETITWPAQLHLLIETFSDFPSQTAAVTYTAAATVKQLGSSVEELHELLMQFDFVKL